MQAPEDPVQAALTADVEAATVPAAPAPPTLARAARPDVPASDPARREAEPFDAAVQHTVDPCTRLRAPVIPAGYESTTVHGVTVAWSTEVARTGPLDGPLRPTSLAALAGGLLDEAAQLTGTERRAELTIVIDASKDAFSASTRAPTWAGGLYDGSVVRLFAQPAEELAVDLDTLRHEIMHAQLHAGVGCMPWWLNEGTAMYFAGEPPLREWLKLLRDRAPYTLATLQRPRVRDFAEGNAHRAYAWALAMTAFVLEPAGEPGLRALLRTVAAADTEARALDVFERQWPGVGTAAVLEALARRLFGIPVGPELDLALDGPVCCAGLRSVGELTCRAGTAPPGPPPRQWLDKATAPVAVCRARW